MEHSCNLCGMVFQSLERLERHRLSFCQGSALHRALLVTREESAGAVTGMLDEEALQKLSSGLNALGDNIEGLGVAELRAKIGREADERKAQRVARQATIQRAAKRLAEERAKTEVQMQLVEAQRAQAQVALLTAQVQDRAAERIKQAADLNRQQHEQERDGHLCRHRGVVMHVVQCDRGAKPIAKDVTEWRNVLRQQARVGKDERTDAWQRSHRREVVGKYIRRQHAHHRVWWHVTSADA